MWTFLPTLCERKRARRRAHKTKKDRAHIERSEARMHAQRANNAQRARAQARKANARARKAMGACAQGNVNGWVDGPISHGSRV